MSNLNQCNFIGRLGRDPEIKSFPTGDKIANFSLAVSENWRDKSSGERKEKTEWVNCVAIGGLVGVIEKYITKGSKLFISGKMQTRKWQDKDGNDRYSTEIRVKDLEMLDGAGGEKSQNNDDYTPQSNDDLDDQIPF